MSPLRKDTACCRQLNWRTDLPTDLGAEGLEAEMVRTGWASRSRHPMLRVFRHPEGHEIAWVVRTGRVQIRVDVEVPLEGRAARAKALYQHLGERLAALLTEASHQNIGGKFEPCGGTDTTSS